MTRGLRELAFWILFFGSIQLGAVYLWLHHH
jgi:hypothetical protein